MESEEPVKHLLMKLSDSLRCNSKWDTAENHCIIALYYMSIEQNAKSIQHFTMALSIYSAILEKYHPKISDAQYNIGLLHARLGNFLESVLFLKQAAKGREKLFGKLHPEVADVYVALADSFSSMNGTDAAIQYYSMADNIFCNAHCQTTINDMELSYQKLLNMCGSNKFLIKKYMREHYRNVCKALGKYNEYSLSILNTL